MGGFVGNICFNGGRPQVTTLQHDREILAANDIKAQWNDGQVSMCVTGPRTGLFWEDDQHVVLFFGNLYETDALAERLGLSPSATHAQLFGRAWTTWATGFTKYIDGAFAAAIWNKAHQTLYLTGH